MNSLWLDAIAATAAMFAAHAAYPNGAYIEPAMVRKEKWAYPLGFLYYTLAVVLGLFVLHKVF